MPHSWLPRLIGWAGIALVVTTFFMPWSETERFGEGLPVRVDSEFLSDAGPVALLVPATPLVLCVLWLVGLLHRASFAYVPAFGLTVWLAFVEIMMPIMSVSQEDERYHARVGLHLALLGFVVLTVSSLAGLVAEGREGRPFAGIEPPRV